MRRVTAKGPKAHSKAYKLLVQISALHVGRMVLHLSNTAASIMIYAP